MGTWPPIHARRRSFPPKTSAFSPRHNTAGYTQSLAVIGTRTYRAQRLIVRFRSKSLILLVPAEGIEPPTFGLQNRCSTAELSRRNSDLSGACRLF
jgi:hypothetical protein